MPRSPARSLWRRRAETLAGLVPRSHLHPAAVAWADSRPAGEAWGVAFSGGADSLAALLLLWAHWPRRRAALCALHFDHRLRGAASREDARFCLAVARGLGLTCESGKWEGARRGASAAEARAARFAFFSRALGSRRCRSLWFGHQQDDVAETLLMRLARGSGTAGLAAPRPVSPGPGGRTHVRPLLSLKKSEIVAALRAAAIPWREDASNAGDDFFRNRVRRRVLPAWVRASGRDALSGAALSRELLEEDDSALEAWVDALRPLTPGGKLHLGRLAGLPRGVVRRALHRWLLAQPKGADLSRQGFADPVGSGDPGADDAAQPRGGRIRRGRPKMA